MGDCDKLNEHISDYLENALDPASRAEFEHGLEQFPELKLATANVLKLTALLGNLPGRKCPEDFVPKLRQRINSETAVKSPGFNVRRYSLAFSFVLVVLVAVVGTTILLNREKSAPALPVVRDFQPAATSVSGGASPADPAAVYSTETGNEVDIKTRAESKMTNDSSAIRRMEQENSRAKQVGHIP